MLLRRSGRGIVRLAMATTSAIATCAASTATKASRKPIESGADSDRNMLPSVATPSASADCWVVVRMPLPTPAARPARRPG